MIFHGTRLDNMLFLQQSPSRFNRIAAACPFPSHPSIKNLLEVLHSGFHT